MPVGVVVMLLEPETTVPLAVTLWLLVILEAESVSLTVAVAVPETVFQ